MASIIGIDIGSWAIKATVLQGGFNRYEVDGQYTKQVTAVDGEIPTSEARYEALRDLLQEVYSEETAQFGTTFPVNHASMRLVSMPFTDKNQIAQTLAFEVEGLVPYDLNDMVLHHRIVSSDTTGSSVLASLTPKDRLGALLAQLSEVGADPKSCVIDGDILGVYGQHGTSAVIDIGHIRTIVTVTKDGETMFSRGISQGGWHLTQALSAHTGLSFSEAELRKHSAQLSTTTPAQWDDDEPTQTGAAPPSSSLDNDGQVLRKALGPLLAGIRTTLISFEDEAKIEIESVMLTGGTAQMSGLLNMLKAELGVSVEMISSGGNGTHSLSAACANRTAGIQGGHAIELRDGEFKFRGDLANMRMLAMFSGAAVVLLGLIGLGAFVYSHQATKTRMAEVDTQIAEVVASAFPEGEAPTTFETPDDALLALQVRTIETTARIDLLGSIVSGKPPTITALSQLSDALPEPSAARVDVSELTVNDSSINMKAETDGYDAAATIESSLQANTKFKRARKGDEKKSRNGIQFSVTISLEDEATEEEG
jgi:type IV pilus assembly protein PilM